MPKEPFDFGLSGRKLFDSERKAVEVFIRKYSFVDGVEPRSQAIASHSRGEVDENLADVSALPVKVSQPKQMKRVITSGKKSMAEREARILALKMAIFGLTVQPSKRK